MIESEIIGKWKIRTRVVLWPSLLLDPWVACLFLVSWRRSQPWVNVSRMSCSLWLFSHLCSLEAETSIHRSSLWRAGLSLPLVNSAAWRHFSLKWNDNLKTYTVSSMRLLFSGQLSLVPSMNFFFLLIISFGLLSRKQPMLIRQTSQTVKNNESTPTRWQRLPSWYVSSQIPFCINNVNSQQSIQRDPRIKRWFCHLSA